MISSETCVKNVITKELQWIIPLVWTIHTNLKGGDYNLPIKYSSFFFLHHVLVCQSVPVSPVFLPLRHDPPCLLECLQ